MPPSAPGGEDFRQLFDRFYRPVVHFFVRRGFTKEESSDLAQETFLRIHRGLSGYRSEASEATWLFRIARNVEANMLRDRAALKRSAEEEVALDDLVDSSRTLPAASGPGPEEQLLSEESHRVLRQAVQTLPRQMRRCLVLRLEDLKYREIADLQGISLQAVRSHLGQARKRLGRLLGDYFEERLTAEEEGQ